MPELTDAIHLVRTDENRDEIDAAAEHLGRRVGIEGVLEHLSRQARRDAVPGRAVEWGLRWEEDDVRTPRWYPQGVTTSADATPTEDLAGRRLVLTSWYSTGRGEANRGSRISVIDLESLRYRHVLLVVPEVGRGGRVRLTPLKVHAGGLVWCGPYLHVAGTRRGMFSCHVEDLLRLDSTEHSWGYRYVLPVRFSYAARASEGVEQMRYSFLSLDRGTDPPELVAGEYGRGEMTRRLVRYPLDPATYHLAAHSDGTSRPVWFDERGVGHMQGAAVVGGRYYVTSSRGPHLLGRLYVGAPGSFRGHRWTLPPGPEDISYWPSTDLLWSLSEHPGRRWVFCLRRSQFD